MRNLRYTAAAAILFVAAAIPSAWADPQPDKPVAIIGSSVISEDEVDRIAAGRPRAFAELPTDQRRLKIIETLIAEYLVDYYYGRDTQQLSPSVLDALNDARRQVLLQFFAQSQFSPPEITDADVRKFVQLNPQLFSERRSYNFAIITLSGGNVDAKQAAQTQLQDMLERSEVDIAALDKMVSGFQGDGVVATLNTAWQSSEALDGEILTRLDAMVRDDQRVDIRQEAGVTSIVLLNSYQAIPTDPEQLRSQIEQRLIAEAFSVHREELIRRMSKTVLDPPEVAKTEEPEDDSVVTVAPPPRGAVVWSSRPTLPRSVRLAALFGLGVFGTLALSFLWLWLRKLWQQYPLRFKDSSSAPLLRKRSTGVVLAAIGSLGLLGTAGLTTIMSIRSLGDTTTTVTLAAGVATALVITGILYLLRLRALGRAVKENIYMYEDIAKAREILAMKGNPLKFLAAAFGFALLYGMALALVLDGPLSLS